MTKKEIETAWSQSKTSGAVQKKFPQEMAQRTVINRAAKRYINTSDDSDLLVQAINNSTENEYDNERVDVTPADEVKKKLARMLIQKLLMLVSMNLKKIQKDIKKHLK